MATVSLKGHPITTSGELPEKGAYAPNFKLTATDLSSKSINDFKGYNLVLNVFPSVDTGVCATSVRQFNEKATDLQDTKVLCISKDLPFALDRFCGASGLKNVTCLSDYKDGNFGKNYGLTFVDGPMEALLSRCVIVLNKEGEVVYTQQVGEITEEPNYEAALNAIP